MEPTRIGPLPWETEPNTPSSRPGLERSWDSFIDSSDVQSSKKRASARASRKLVGIGRKAMGRERFVTDEERARMDAAEVESTAGNPEPSGWWNKTFSIFKRGENTAGNDVRSPPTPSPPPVPPLPTRNKANLTIRTSGAPGNLPVPVRSPDMPGSAWSVSPAMPRRLPWMNQPSQTAAKRPSISPPKAIRPKSRRNVSVPQSISMGQRPSYLLPHPGVNGGFSFDAANPFMDQRTSSLYPVTPQAPQTYTSRHDRVAPFEMQPDPFRTPFDDDAQIPRSGRGRGNSVSQMTNPSTPIAL